MSNLDENTKDRIQTEIDASEVVLFMKGTPVFPQCGFSSMVYRLNFSPTIFSARQLINHGHVTVIGRRFHNSMSRESLLGDVI